MIDLHCHLLPAVDDGAQNLEESLAMAEKAVEQGITHILCTPHHNNGKYCNQKKKVIPLVATLQKELDKKFTVGVIRRSRSSYYWRIA